MSTQKESIVKARLNDALATQFQRICDIEGETVSATLRKLIECYVITHDITRKNIMVDVKLGNPYGRGAAEKDEYELTANITGDIAELEDLEIDFLLPEFFIDGFEHYRIDSFYYHRSIFPNSKSEFNKRLLGSKTIKNQWKGALFLYKGEYIGNPELCFDNVKKKLEESILNAIQQHLIEMRKQMPNDLKL